MKRFAKLRGSLTALAACLSVVAISGAEAQTVVSTSTSYGRVHGTYETSDAFIWRLLVTQIAAPITAGHPTPAMFEAWASDIDIFRTSPPHFPTVNEPHKFQGSVLGAALHGGAIDAPCSAPNNPLAGGFPTTGPSPCIAEEVKRNRPQYDYIVNNDLYRKSGLAAAFARAATINMPPASISVKGDWVPVPTLIRWIPKLATPANVEKSYFTTTVGSVEYALVSMHVSSKQNPNWVWGTFEHSSTPGRCDYIGCYDSYGAVASSVPPNRRAYNTQYGECQKTPDVLAMMARYGLSPVWQNYCLKGTQVNYTAFGEKPSSLANSVTEGINAGGSIVGGSCISCHSYAAFGAKGTATSGALGMLAFNPTGNPVPGVLAGGDRYDFMWGFLLAK